MTFKYPVWTAFLTLLLSVSSCVQTAAPSSPSPITPGASPSPTVVPPSPSAAGLAAAPFAR